MKKFIVIIGAALILSAQPTIFAGAQQQGMGPGGGGRGAHQGRMWNQQTVETNKGEVTGIEKQTFSKEGRGQLVRLTLKTDKETIPVILGPSRFIDKQEIKVAPKDLVEITGSRVTIKGQTVILASEIKKGDKLLKLREADGKPVWAGQGRRRLNNQ